MMHIWSKWDKCTCTTSTRGAYVNGIFFFSSNDIETSRKVCQTRGCIKSASAGKEGQRAQKFARCCWCLGTITCTRLGSLRLTLRRVHMKRRNRSLFVGQGKVWRSFCWQGYWRWCRFIATLRKDLEWNEIYIRPKRRPGRSCKPQALTAKVWEK